MWGNLIAYLSSTLINVKTILCFVWLFSETCEATTCCKIITPAGNVQGSLLQKNNFTVVAYKSVPFAKPPIGDLRFKRPQPLDNSPNVVINSENYKKSCWSATTTSKSKYYGEDCLYLNIYTQQGVGLNTSVMVWLHGGGFVAGSTFPEPLKMVHQGQVIVVTVNYRLGVLGFLTTQDEAFPSNNGLWDQYMALKWVKENIQHFNGDANSITLFGESAGAMSAALHVISPVSSNLFNKVILQSGAMASMLSRNPQGVVDKFAELVGCKTSSGRLDRNCLKNVSIVNVLTYSKPEWYASNEAQKQIDFIWLPVIDKEFIPADPLSLIHNVSFLEEQAVFEKDYMIGVLNDEGGILTNNFFYPIPVTKLENSQFFNDLQRFLLKSRYGANICNLQAAMEAVNKLYTGQTELTSPPNATSVLDFCGDIALVTPAVEAAQAFTQTQAPKRAKTFFYLFDYCPQYGELGAPCLTHGADVALEFPKRAITDPVKAQLSDLFISLLTRFSRSSDPGAAVSSGWPEFEPNQKRFLRIVPSPEVGSDLYAIRINFWLETMPCILRRGSNCG